VGRVSGQESSPTARTTDCAYNTQETLVLYDQCSRSVADDVIVSTTTSQMTSYHVVSVLLRRLKQDGFRVYLLDGKPRVVLDSFNVFYEYSLKVQQTVESCTDFDETWGRAAVKAEFSLMA